MSLLTWFIENHNNRDDIEKLYYSVRKQGYHLVESRAKNFDINKEIPSYTCVISSCSPETAYRISKRDKFIPGVFCDFDQYKCSQYYPILGQWKFNENYIILPYGDLLRRKKFIFDYLSSSNCIFIRSDNKFNFPGRLIEQRTYDRDISRLGLGSIEHDTLVIIAIPKFPKREWRIFVAEDGIITGSQYKHHGRAKLDKNIPTLVADFAINIINYGQYLPDEVVAIDICEDIKGDLYLMDIGPFSCSEIYQADTDLLVEAVSEKAILHFKGLLI